MGNKMRILLKISGIILCLTLLILTTKFILDTPYRKLLPEYPDFKDVSKPVQDQIIAEGRKTYFNPTDNNLGTLGMIYYSSSFYDKAAQCYELAVKKNSQKWIWSYYLGYLNLEQSESKTSIENFKLVLEKNPGNSMALFHIGEAYRDLGINNEAINVFKKIINSDNPDFDGNVTLRESFFPLKTYAMFHLARIYLKSNQLDSAELYLKELIKTNISFGPAYRVLGNVYTLKGNVQMGKDYTIRANDLAEYTPPQDPQIDKIVMLSRSDIYLLKQIDDAIRSNNYKFALALCNHALKYLPENKYFVSKAIFGYLSMGSDKMALPYLDRHIKYYSQDFNELINTAQILYDKGYMPQAMKYFNQAKKIKPGNSRLAIWLSERGMTEDAVNLITDQLKKDPENLKTLADAVHLMWKLNDKEMATVYLNTLKRLAPLNVESLKLTGMMAEADGKLKDAISEYEEALKKDPKDIFLIKYLAKIYVREQMWDKAINHFWATLKTYPNEPILLQGLGNIMVSCPDTKLLNINEGREYAERAFINYKSSIQIIVAAGENLASAYAILGDKKQCAKYIRLTINQANNENVAQDYMTFFEGLKKQYNITD